jgi:hypothetical protein
LPPDAAQFHSASVGKRPPSQMQKAKAWNQLTQLIGRLSLPPFSLSVQVCCVLLHFKPFALVSDAASAGRLVVFHVASQPGSSA